MTVRLEAAALTHAGRVRRHNEDSLFVDAAAGIAVLADGMGGHNAGEVASRMAVERLAADVPPPATPVSSPAREAEHLLAERMAAANHALIEAARADAGCAGMGTTLVAALWHGQGVSYAHVGDSRLYRLRAGAFDRLTRDHSIVQEQLERGELSPEDARHAPHRNVLTRAVGADAVLRPDIRSEPVEPDDVYLFCSDGLTDMLSDADIRELLLPLAAGPHETGAMAAAAQALITRANERGGLDNISVIVVRVAGEPASA